MADAHESNVVPSEESSNVESVSAQVEECAENDKAQEQPSIE